MIPLALAVFFLSGLAALLYQVIWQRMLVMFSGADVYSTTVIVAAFMAGLGIGSLVGGRLADRFPRYVSLLLFAAAELGVAAFSLLSRPLYYDVLYATLGALVLPEAAIGGVLFASLLWPTFLMGVSLPLLARALTDRIEQAPRVVGALYGINTLGAAAGALIGTWWLMPRFGLETSLRLGAIANVACALVVLPMVPRLVRMTRPAETSAGVAQPAGAGASQRFSTWALIAALSGWLALSLEIVWFRLLGVMVKSTAFTFGTLLAIYLTGLAVGSLTGSLLAPRIRRPAAAFLLLQAAVGLTAAGLLAWFVAAAVEIPALREYFAGYEPLDAGAGLNALFDRGDMRDAAGFLLMYFVVPGALILPPTFLMGLAFPVLQRVVQTDLTQLGRRVGLLLLANIAGSTAGAVITGWVLLDTLGAAGTLKVLTVSSGVFAWLSVVMRQGGPERPAPHERPERPAPHGAPERPASHERPERPAPHERPERPAPHGAPERPAPQIQGGWATWKRLTAAAAATLLVAVTVGATPDAATLWARLHGAPETRIVFGEDAAGLALVRLDRLQGVGATVFVNGLGQSTMPYGDVHTALGMVPAFVHPAPRDAAVIGLGSGDTLYGVAGRPDLERIVSIEIIRPQLDTLRRYAALQPYGGVLGLLDDPRITHVAGDGRIFLMRAAARFDIIEADALRPSSAYSGNLYSDEYFRLVRSRLRPGGLAVTWAPTRRVRNAFVRVFPHVVGLPGMLLGSTAPIVVDRDAIAARLADPRAREHYARAGIAVEPLMEKFLAHPAYYGPDFDRTALADFNTDLFPRDEFDLRRSR